MPQFLNYGSVWPSEKFCKMLSIVRSIPSMSTKCWACFHEYVEGIPLRLWASLGENWAPFGDQSMLVSVTQYWTVPVSLPFIYSFRNYWLMTFDIVTMIMLALNCLILLGFSLIAFLFFMWTELTERFVSEVCAEYNYYITTTWDCIVRRCLICTYISSGYTILSCCSLLASTLYWTKDLIKQLQYFLSLQVISP